MNKTIIKLFVTISILWSLSTTVTVDAVATVPVGKVPVNEFFHIEREGYFIPVMLRGNLSAGKIIVFVQGGPGMNTLDFATIDYPGWKKTLERDFAVAYYDPRGMGNRQGNFRIRDISVDQYLEDIYAVVKTLQQLYKVEVSLLGHSYGGYLVYRYILKYGNRGLVQKYITADAPATTDQDVDIRLELRRKFLLNMANEELSKNDSTTFWKDVRQWCIDHDKINEKEERRTWNNMVSKGVGDRYKEKAVKISDYLKVAFFSSYNPLVANLNMSIAEEVENSLTADEKDFKVVDHLQQIDQPLLLLTGRHDDVCPPEELAFIFEHISSPEKKYVIIQQAGHESYNDQPSLFYQAVEAFLK
jgi:pimeloyl-ACP methyl ester carboxylesterase